jgi:serine/threonine protein kinase
MNKEEYLKVSNEQIISNYKIQKSLGKGAFSQVYKVNDLSSNNEYALKIGRLSSRFQKSYQNEIEYLKILNKENNPNIINMIDNFVIEGRYFLVFEVFGKNLYQYLGNNHYKGLKIDIVEKFTYQLINGLKLLKNIKLIHSDLKPENILVSDTEDKIKIIDFGSSFYEKNGRYCNYIQTRYYRSPEVLLGLPVTTNIDIWSLGCIIYEMIRGYPLFKAKNYQDLFLYHTNLLGIPDSKIIKESQYGNKYIVKDNKNYKLLKNYDSKKIIFDPGTRFIERHRNKENEKVFNILLKCLKWEPKKRLNLKNV